VLNRTRALWQRARHLDRDLKEQGATGAQRFALLAQKARAVLIPPGTRRFKIYETIGRPLARPLLTWTHNQRHGIAPLWNRQREFDPATGAIGEQETLAFPKFDNPRCSILLPVFGKWQHTYTCLRSILLNTSGISYEVLVLDDCSPDETAELTRVVTGARFLRNAENLGFLRNCNAGAAQARGSTLLLLNNDTSVEPGWLSALHLALDADSAVGLVGAKLVDVRGRLQEAGGVVWKDGSGWNYGRGGDPTASEFEYLKEVDYCSGACLLMPTALWRELGGFDDRYAPAYYEDTDLAFAVRAAGRKVVYQPRACVVHLEGVSHGKQAEEGIKRFQEVNRLKFADKWRATLEAEQSAGPSDLFRARDRSQRRLHVVVVDHTVPAWDVDAGSRLTWMYLQLLVAEGFRVSFLPMNHFAAQPYTRCMQDLGVEVLCGGAHGPQHRAWLARHGRDLHAVYLHRPHVAEAYVRHLQEHAPQARIVYQCHDLHHLREQRRHEAEGGRGEGSEALSWRNMEVRALTAAHVVHTPSTFERDWIAQRFPGKSVRDVPIYFWEQAPLDGRPEDGGDLTSRSEADLLFVGGFRHPPNEAAVLWFAREVLPLVRARVPAARLLLAGGHPTAGVKALPKDSVRILGRLSDEELAAAYRSARIALVPMVWGAGVKGKLIEALAWGLPVVSTPVGAEGVGGIEEAVAIGASPAEFAAEVVELLQDEALWRRRRAAGLKLVAQSFSAQRAREIVREDFAAQAAPAGVPAANRHA
jgi:GT2 family glycosyltransferase